MILNNAPLPSVQTGNFIADVALVFYRIANTVIFCRFSPLPITWKYEAAGKDLFLLASPAPIPLHSVQQPALIRVFGMILVARTTREQTSP